MLNGTPAYQVAIPCILSCIDVAPPQLITVDCNISCRWLMRNQQSTNWGLTESKIAKKRKVWCFSIGKSGSKVGMWVLVLIKEIIMNLILVIASYKS